MFSWICFVSESQQTYCWYKHWLYAKAVELCHKCNTFTDCLKSEIYTHKAIIFFLFQVFRYLFLIGRKLKLYKTPCGLFNKVGKHKSYFIISYRLAGPVCSKSVGINPVVNPKWLFRVLNNYFNSEKRTYFS